MLYRLTNIYPFSPLTAHIHAKYGGFMAALVCATVKIGNHAGSAIYNDNGWIEFLICWKPFLFFSFFWWHEKLGLNCGKWIHVENCQIRICTRGVGIIVAIVFLVYQHEDEFRDHTVMVLNKHQCQHVRLEVGHDNAAHHDLQGLGWEGWPRIKGTEANPSCGKDGILGLQIYVRPFIDWRRVP